MSIASNLKQQMTAHDLSAAQLAEISGVSKGAISIYLKGHTKPADEILAKLAYALRCTTEDLEKPRQIRQRGCNVPVETAARIMGKPAQWLRIMLQQERLPFGFADRRDGSNRYSYYINQADFEAFVGVRVEDVV